MVAPPRFELGTQGSSGLCSTGLSYSAILNRLYNLFHAASTGGLASALRTLTFHAVSHSAATLTYSTQ